MKRKEVLNAADYVLGHIRKMKIRPALERYETEPKKLDAAIELLTRYALMKLNCPLKRGIEL